jgi:hypothetical protein
MLSREEYVEQAYLFRVLLERLGQNTPIQDLFEHVKQELLATTKLVMAVDFLLSDMKHLGIMSSGMRRLAHYFSPFQAFLVEESENDRGRFDLQTAFQILRAEADYRANSDSRQGMFFYQFESLCRNRLNYDRGLKAIAEDPAYDDAWTEWILLVRKQLGLVDIADLIYTRSQEFENYRRQRLGPQDAPAGHRWLFGEKEGKIARAHRQKEPLFLFAAMQRHLGYPSVPRPVPADESVHLIPQLMRRMERLETRIKLFEEEQRQGIDITKFYNKAAGLRLQLPPIAEEE